MATSSRAGPGEGMAKPEAVIVESYDEFGDDHLFVAWRGNGYREDDCWLLADLDIVCKLSSWE